MSANVFLANTLHAITAVLEGPVIVCLLIFICLTIMAVGSIIAEYFVERRKLKRDVSKFLNQLKGANPEQIKEQIEASKFLRRQKNALLQIVDNRNLDPELAQSLTEEIVSDQDLRYQKILAFTDFIVKIGPMLGLMGTLIPLGPGLIALGQGDIKSLADALLVAFDTTIAGLAVGGIAYAVSRIRKLWYEKDMNAIETLSEGVLGAIYDE